MRSQLHVDPVLVIFLDASRHYSENSLFSVFLSFVPRVGEGIVFCGDDAPDGSYRVTGVSYNIFPEGQSSVATIYVERLRDEW